MKIYLNKKGVALVLVLMIVVLSAALLAVIMYYSMTGTEISGLQRKYETSKEASLGAVEIFTKDIIPSVLQNQAAGLSGITGALTQGVGIVDSVVPVSSNACFLSKLTSTTGSWSGCTGNPTSTDPTDSADITFSLLSAAGSSRPFVVNAKIIDTATGNSSMSGMSLEGAGVVETGLGEITTRHFPYLYTMMVQGQLQNSTTERANFEILYAY